MATITGKVVRDAQEKATHYEMRTGDKLLGITKKDDEGFFVFEPAKDCKTPTFKSKTMRDVKLTLNGRPPPRIEEKKKKPAKEPKTAPATETKAAAAPGAAAPATSTTPTAAAKSEEDLDPPEEGEEDLDLT